MEENRGEARGTDLNFLPPAGHATCFAASVLWTFPLTSLDPGRRGNAMDGTLRLIARAVIPIGRIFCGGLTEGDEGGGYKISEQVKRMEGRRRH